MTLGESIRKHRTEKGITQKELGESCGIAESAIRRYELGGAKPKMETLGKIAAVLDISCGELLAQTNDTRRKLVPSVDYIYHSEELGDILIETEKIDTSNSAAYKNALNLYVTENEFSEDEYKQLLQFAIYIKNLRK